MVGPIIENHNQRDPLKSDATSKINYIKSMNRIFILLLLFNVLAGIYNLSIGSVINSSVGCLNVIVSVMVIISVSKNEKRKKGLKQDLHIFEG